jgi:inner membrane protein
MDNLTHSLVGVFLARAGLNRLAPDAMPILLLAANAPDIDVVSFVGGSAALLTWHRGLTHSLVFSIILAVAVVAVVRIFSKVRTGWLLAVAASLVGVLSHLLLDLTNTYGVRLLEPFSKRWFEWDLTYVVDPYIWAVLILAFGVPLIGRLLSSELGGRKRKYPPRTWAVLALSFLVFYGCGRMLLHARAVSILYSRLYNAETPRRVAAFPTPLSPFHWQALTETSDRYYLYNLDLEKEFRPDSGKLLYKNDPDGAVPVLSQQKDFGALIGFAQYPLWRVLNEVNNSNYRLTDLRFGDPAQQTFTCAANVISKSVADEHCDFTFAPNFGTQ